MSRRLKRPMRMLLAAFLALSAVSSAVLMGFLRNGGHDLLAFVEEQHMVVARSRMRRLQWSADFVDGDATYRVDLAWGSLSEPYRSDATPGDTDIVEYPSEDPASSLYSVRLVTASFSLLVQQSKAPAGPELAREFVEGFRSMMERRGIAYTGRLHLLSASVNWMERPLGEALGMLSSGSGERWDTIIWGSLDTILQALLQGSTRWQLPIFALAPARGNLPLLWLWTAGLAVAALALSAPALFARLVPVRRSNRSPV